MSKAIIDSLDIENRKLLCVGSALSTEDQMHVLASYVHRFTRDHKPAWASGIWRGGPYPLQFDSDQDWLAHTYFAVRKDGRLNMRHHICFSHPTWPDNPELRGDLKMQTILGN
jgi:hypothetical protein